MRVDFFNWITAYNIREYIEKETRKFKAARFLRYFRWKRFLCPADLQIRQGGQSCFYQVLGSALQKKRATVPGPVWEPIRLPIQLISTLPLSFGKVSSIKSATARASS